MEILGLLNPGIAPYREVVSRGSSIGKLSKSEIPGLLRGLTTVEVDYLWAVAGDLKAERALLLHTQMWAIARHWSTNDAQIILLATLAVFEAITPGKCARCRGTGIVKDKVCKVCNGSGIKYLSNRRIADALGINESTFRRVWKSRYNELLSYLHGLENIINSTIYRNQCTRYLDER